MRMGRWRWEWSRPSAITCGRRQCGSAPRQTTLPRRARRRCADRSIHQYSAAGTSLCLKLYCVMLVWRPSTATNDYTSRARRSAAFLQLRFRSRHVRIPHSKLLIWRPSTPTDESGPDLLLAAAAGGVQEGGRGGGEMRETRRLSAHFMTPALNLSSSFLQCSRDLQRVTRWRWGGREDRRLATQLRICQHCVATSAQSPFI